MAGLRDRAGELRQLELVTEQPRRAVAPCLPRVDDAEPEKHREERKRGEEPVGERPVAVCRAGARRDQAHSLAAPRTTRGSRSVSRRTNRQGTSACAQLPTTTSSRSRPAFGIVTRTVSGRTEPRI